MSEIDAQSITPEQFVELVKNANDEEIATTIRGAGTEQVLDQIFDGMQQRFKADAAGDTNATFQFVVTDEGNEYPYAIDIANGSCSVAKEKKTDARTTITTDLVSFTRLISGQAQGPQLFMAGKLKVAGDIFFSQNVTKFFDQPA
jgi:putative sterol carrier protein